MGLIKRLLSVAISLIMLIGVIFPVYADEIDDAQRKLDEISGAISRNQSNLEEAKAKENSILGQIQSVEKSISQTEGEINSLADRISSLESNIEQTAKEIMESEEELTAKKGILNERLVFIYEEGNISYLEVLLSAADFKDFLTRYDMLNSIVDQDMELIASINKEKKDLNSKKSELEVKKKELLSIQASQESKKEELDSQHEKKKEILTSVKQEKNTCLKALAELEKASKQFKEIIRNAQSGGKNTTVGTGTYTWPTPGYRGISSPYGMRLHPILNARRMHTGVDLRAPMGATIVAADSGTVIYAGGMGGYGNVIIVDHGKGMSTLYAHQSKFLVGKGANVEKGQAIGKVGTTGWSTGPHLHFEVRINGSYTDPMPYIQ